MDIRGRVPGEGKEQACKKCWSYSKEETIAGIACKRKHEKKLTARGKREKFQTNGERRFGKEKKRMGDFPGGTVLDTEEREIFT